MSNFKYTNLPSEAPGEDSLAQLALDLSCSWDRTTGSIWERLDPELWKSTHNPWIVLQTVSGKKLREIGADPEFQKALKQAIQERCAARDAPRWFNHAHPGAKLKTVAYFSMEYMLSEALPIYSGGLGNVAGDQLKAADDLGVPVVAVGLLYGQGYFRQEIGRDGSQRAIYPFNDSGQMPVRPARDASGDWLRLAIPFPGAELWVRAWQAQIGRTKLYLLDTNDPANIPEYRGISGELYGGGPEDRLRQEHVLGIGGWRLLRALGIHPEVCHLNEGHAAFAVLERAANYMDDNGVPFPVALTITRAGNLFTTHTAVEAGFDRFDSGLMRTHFERYCSERLKIPFESMLALGRHDGDQWEPFNMAFLALRGCGAVNGVSRLHGAVSRRLFQPLFPRWPTEEVPVRHVTNGIHVNTWDSSEARQLWSTLCGEKCWRTDLNQVEAQISHADDSTLWRMRNAVRSQLVDYARSRYARQVAIQGGSSDEIAKAGQIFDPNFLTLGFARRFATYKRPNLLLHDPGRLMSILCNKERPVQLILAGKAHPQDIPGQDMIRQWTRFIQSTDARSRVAFMSDYDMLLTEQMVRGVDVWINTPRRPWEASGTSGMKVLVNGGVNVSELDGWWAEAYTPDVGWAIGDGHEHGDDPAWDAADAEELYSVLEQQVVPEFYDRDGSGFPAKWMARMRNSMSRLTPAYSANRTVREYTENHYLPAAAAYAARSDRNSAAGKQLFDWYERVLAHWGGLRFGPLRIESGGRIEIPVYEDHFGPDEISVELFADGRDGADPVRIPMQRGASQPDGSFLYSATIAGRAASDFTPRIIPNHSGASIPLEANQIVWQR